MSLLKDKLLEVRQAIGTFPVVTPHDKHVMALDEAIMRLDYRIVLGDNERALVHAENCLNFTNKLSIAVGKQLRQHDFTSDKGAMIGFKHACLATDEALNDLTRCIEQVVQQISNDNDHESRPNSPLPAA